MRVGKQNQGSLSENRRKKISDIQDSIPDIQYLTNRGVAKRQTLEN